MSTEKINAQIAIAKHNFKRLPWFLQVYHAMQLTISGAILLTLFVVFIAYPIINDYILMTPLVMLEAEYIGIF